jgi:hypothetical protein
MTRANSGRSHSEGSRSRNSATCRGDGRAQPVAGRKHGHAFTRQCTLRSWTHWSLPGDAMKALPSTATAPALPLPPSPRHPSPLSTPPAARPRPPLPPTASHAAGTHLPRVCHQPRLPRRRGGRYARVKRAKHLWGGDRKGAGCCGAGRGALNLGKWCSQAGSPARSQRRAPLPAAPIFPAAPAAGKGFTDFSRGACGWKRAARGARSGPGGAAAGRAAAWQVHSDARRTGCAAARTNLAQTVVALGVPGQLPHE